MRNSEKKNMYSYTERTQKILKTNILIFNSHVPAKSECMVKNQKTEMM